MADLDISQAEADNLMAMETYPDTQAPAILSDWKSGLKTGERPKQ